MRDEYLIRRRDMPIPRPLFDQEIDPLDRRILDILDRDPAQAFTFGDLAAQLKLGSALVPLLDLSARLDDLSKKNHIVSRSIHGIVYYATAKQPKA